MYGEIIAIGDELISGRVLNTTSTFVAHRLTLSGYSIKRITVIGDDISDIRECLLGSLERCSFLIITGGLGATADDITNEAVASALGLELEVRQELLDKIKECGHRCDMAGGSYLQKMATLPKGAEILDIDSNAAGYLLNYDGKVLFFLPGVPSQLKIHMEKQVVPRLEKLLGPGQLVLYKVFKIFGLGETEINQKLEPIESDFPDVQIGYYPNFPEIYVTVTVRGKEKGSDIKGIFESACDEIRQTLERDIVAEDRESLEAVLGNLLLEKKSFLAVAESCTGGLVGQRITSVPGSSGWFECGAITYSNKAKTKILKVPSKIIEQHGAVSEQTAKKMVEGVMELGGVSFGLSLTGIAGPTGGTPAKPVGTVFIGMGTPEGVFVERFLFPGDRREIRLLASETALDWLRRYLKYGTNIPGYRPAKGFD